MTKLFQSLVPMADRLSRILMGLSALLLIILTLIISWQIFGRYVLNDTPKWTEQLAGIFIVYIALLGGASALWEGRHIALTGLRNMLPGPLATSLEILLRVLIGGLGFVMVWHGSIMIELVQLWQLPALGISRSVNYLAFPPSGIALIIFTLLLGHKPRGDQQ